MDVKEKVDWRIVLTGLVCLTVLECVALMNGVDGILLTAVIGIIAAGIGVAIPSSIIKHK